jgi:hypothetical protein
MNVNQITVESQCTITTIPLEISRISSLPEVQTCRWTTYFPQSLLERYILDFIKQSINKRYAFDCGSEPCIDRYLNDKYLILVQFVKQEDHCIVICWCRHIDDLMWSNLLLYKGSKDE